MRENDYNWAKDRRSAIGTRHSANATANTRSFDSRFPRWRKRVGPLRSGAKLPPINDGSKYRGSSLCNSLIFRKNFHIFAR